MKIRQLNLRALAKHQTENEANSFWVELDFNRFSGLENYVAAKEGFSAEEKDFQEFVRVMLTK